MVTDVVYANVTDLKAMPGIVGTDDDSLLNLLLRAASRCIDNFCNRQMDGFQASATATTRTYAGTNYYTLFIDECVEVTSVQYRTQVGGTWVPINMSEIQPFTGSTRTPNFNRKPYTSLLWVTNTVSNVFPKIATMQMDGAIYPSVEVTARWGYAIDIPDTVGLATLIQASRWYKRGQSFWADSTSSELEGRKFYRLTLDPDVNLLLTEGRLVRPIYG